MGEIGYDASEKRRIPNCRAGTDRIFNLAEHCSMDNDGGKGRRNHRFRSHGARITENPMGIKVDHTIEQPEYDGDSRTGVGRVPLKTKPGIGRALVYRFHSAEVYT